MPWNIIVLVISPEMHTQGAYSWANKGAFAVWEWLEQFWIQKCSFWTEQATAVLQWLATNTKARAHDGYAWRGRTMYVRNGEDVSL